MARICNSCGSPLPDGTSFCTQCGAKSAVPVRPGPQPSTRQASEAQAEKAVSTGTFFGLMFLFSLPVLGWLICVIMAFAPKNKNIKHFARAILIWLIIALVVSFLLGLAINALIGSATAYINEAMGETAGLGDLNGLLSEFAELESALAELQ